MKMQVNQLVKVWTRFFIDVPDHETPENYTGRLIQEDYSLNNVEPCSAIEVLFDTAKVFETQFLNEDEEIILSTAASANQEKEFVVSVDFKTNDYSSAPSFVKIILTPEDYAKIKVAQTAIIEHDFDSVRLDTAVADYFFDEDCEEPADWNSDYNCLVVWRERVYYYAQNKYDSADQIETGEIPL
jgi:hypothetical protein